MRFISKYRKHKLAKPFLLLFSLCALGFTFSIATAAPASNSMAADARSTLIEEGQQIFLKGCSSCHGLNGEGAGAGPALIGVGAASARLIAKRRDLAFVFDKINDTTDLDKKVLDNIPTNGMVDDVNKLDSATELVNQIEADPYYRMIRSFNDKAADLSKRTFGKQTDYANQLAQANIMANMSDRTVLRDTIRGNKKLADAMLEAGKISQDMYNEALGIKMYGGTIKKRSFKK